MPESPRGGRIPGQTTLPDRTRTQRRHDLGKYLRLLVKNNGYVLEQIFSPLVVTGEEFLAELRPLARRCITRHHYHHYRGFLATQRKTLEKQQPKMVKTLLYAYHVVLTGIH